MVSDASITLFMSCETTTVVMLYSRVMSLIKLSITIAVWGSKPEFGSSQNRYFGFIAMARAMPTRFCMPPEISAGKRPAASSSSTRRKQSIARSRIPDADKSLNMRNGN